jgi:hypothetical protein
MLAEFQQALADLTASPELCVRARSEPSLLRVKYELTEREWNRLVAIVQHRGMACACIVYRANRLAPLALNIPRTCKALGSNLRAVVSEFWTAFPETNVHFFVETDRFCSFLRSKVAGGRIASEEVDLILAEESAVVAAALQESRTESGNL